MRKVLFLAALIVVAAATSSYASLGIGARALGMGGAFTALVNDETALYWNPSLLGKAKTNFSLSLPAIGMTYKSNMSREDIDDLSGDEMETLGNLDLDLGISGMIGFHQNNFGLGAVMDTQAQVRFTGNGLSNLENAINVIGASNAGNYQANMAAVGITATTTISMGLDSAFFGTGGGVVGYAVTYKGFEIGANLKILQGQLYAAEAAAGINISNPANAGAYTADSTALAASLTCAGCTIGMVVDADGSGFGLDLAASKKIGDLGFLSDARVAFVARDLFSSVKVSGTATSYGIYDSDPTAGVSYKTYEIGGSAVPFSTTVNISPELVAGVAGTAKGGLTVAADFAIDTDDASIGANVGVEKKTGIFALRAGLGTSTVTDDFSWAIGLGLDFKAVALDLAYGGGSGGNNETLAASLRVAF